MRKIDDIPSVLTLGDTDRIVADVVANRGTSNNPAGITKTNFFNNGAVTSTGSTTSRSFPDRFANLFTDALDFGLSTSNTGTANTTALQAAIDYRASQGGGFVMVPAGNFKLGVTGINVAKGVTVVGAGLGEWVPNYLTFRLDTSKGTTFILEGTGTKSNGVFGITDCSISGGVVTNPAAAESYCTNNPTPSYALTNFYNSDASGATPATQKLFSAGFIFNGVNNAGIMGCRIVPNYDGQEGYKDSSLTGLGDAWDFGVWIRNSHNINLQSVQAVGYYREAALCVTTMPEPSASYAQPSAESNRFVNCVFQGRIGALIRSGDVYRCTAVTSSTVEIGWHDSNPFPAANGKLRFNGIGSTASFDYTSTSRVGDKITFNGVTPDPSAAGVVVGTEVRTSVGNLGTSGTVFEDCYITGLEHTSTRLSTNTSINLGVSKCLEISGDPIRDIRLINCTIQTQEDIIAHFHDARDIYFIGSYWEGKGAFGSVAQGARFIGSPAIASSTATYPAGETNDVYFIGCSSSQGSIDKSPRWERSASTRFGATTGLWTPNRFTDTEFQSPPDDDTTIIGLMNGGNWALRDYLGVTRLRYFSATDDLELPVNGFLSIASGEMDIRSATNTDLVRIRNGSDTAVTFGQTTSTFASGVATAGSITKTSGELDLRSATNTDLVRIRNGADTAVTFGQATNTFTGGIATNGSITKTSGELDLRSAGTSDLIRLRLGSVTNATFGSTTTNFRASTEVVPNTDNAVTLGGASNRWSVVYAGNGTINTSDVNEKQQIENIDDKLLEVIGKINFRQFKFNDAVSKKGNNARIHFGVIAQEVKKLFDDAGIDGVKYGILCYDKWDAQEAVYEIDTETGEQVILSDAREAGERWGIRYEQLLILYCAYLQKKFNN